MPTTKMKTERRFEIDLERFPAVVFESDDWGAAEYTPSEDLRDVISQILPGRSVNPKLESPAELQALYSILEKHRGADGLNPVFTAFTQLLLMKLESMVSFPRCQRSRLNNYALS